MEDIEKIINWIKQEYISDYKKMEIGYNDEFRLFKIHIRLTKFSVPELYEDIEIRIKSFFPIDMDDNLKHIIEVVILDGDYLEYDILDYYDFTNIINTLRNSIE